MMTVKTNKTNPIMKISLIMHRIERMKTPRISQGSRRRYLRKSISLNKRRHVGRDLHAV